MDRILTDEGKKVFEQVFCAEPFVSVRKQRLYSVVRNGEVIWSTRLETMAAKQLKNWNAVNLMRSWRRIECLKLVRDEVVFEIKTDEERDNRLNQLTEEVLDSAVFLLREMGIPDEIIEQMDDDMREDAVSVQSGLNNTNLMYSGVVDSNTGQKPPIFAKSP